MTPNISFTTLPELIYSPWRLGLLFQGPSGQLSFLVGYAQLLVLFLAIVFLIKKSIEKKYLKLLILSLVIIFSMVFMMLSISKPLWFIIPLMKNFQFSYRLLGITIFAFSVIAAIVTTSIKKTYLIIFLCFFVVLSTILNWGNRQTLPDITDQVLYNALPQEADRGGGLGQAITMWSDQKHPLTGIVPKNHMEILRGKGSIKDITRETNKHVYQVNARTQLTVRENTLYYPYWHVYIDGNPQKITILTNTKPRGIISFSIPKGDHTIELKFLDSPELRMGKAISFVTLVIMIIFGSMNKKLSISKKKKHIS